MVVDLPGESIPLASSHSLPGQVSSLLLAEQGQHPAVHTVSQVAPQVQAGLVQIWQCNSPGIEQVGEDPSPASLPPALQPTGGPGCQIQGGSQGVWQAHCLVHLRGVESHEWVGWSVKTSPTALQQRAGLKTRSVNCSFGSDKSSSIRGQDWQSYLQVSVGLEIPPYIWVCV